MEVPVIYMYDLRCCLVLCSNPVWCLQILALHTFGLRLKPFTHLYLYASCSMGNCDCWFHHHSLDVSPLLLSSDIRVEYKPERTENRRTIQSHVMYWQSERLVELVERTFLHFLLCFYRLLFCFTIIISLLITWLLKSQEIPSLFLPSKREELIRWNHESIKMELCIFIKLWLTR